MISLSLCMIVKNEEAVLERILKPVSQVMDAILIADTGSSDRTKEIAEQYTSLVYDFPWCDDFSAPRNFLLEKVRTDYWMWMDADDVLNEENLEALEKGIPNLMKHVSNIKNVYGLPCVVAINAFPTDTKAELDLVEEKCKEVGVNVALSEVWAKGGEGGLKLAEEVVRLCDEPSDFHYAYELEGTIEDKLNQIVQKIYGGNKVVLTAAAQKQAKQLTDLGFGNAPICMAKTQYSLTDDPKKLGAPTDFDITVRNLKVSAGAGFIVALTGDIMTMPGLPKVPAAERIDVDDEGRITGLF